MKVSTMMHDPKKLILRILILVDKQVISKIDFIIQED